MAGMFSLQHSRSLWLNFNPSVRLMMQQVSWIKYHLYDPFSFHRCMTHLFPPCAWEDLRRVKLSLSGFWSSLSSLGHGLTKLLTDLSPAALLKASKRCSFIHSLIQSLFFLPINLFIYSYHFFYSSVFLSTLTCAFLLVQECLAVHSSCYRW